MSLDASRLSDLTRRRVLISRRRRVHSQEGPVLARRPQTDHLLTRPDHVQSQALLSQSQFDVPLSLMTRRVASALQDPSALVECARTLRTHRMYHNPSLYGTIVCLSINAPPPPDIAPAKVKGSVNVAKPGSKPGGSNSKATAAAVPAKAAAGEEKKASAWDWTKKKPKEKEEEKKVGGHDSLPRLRSTLSELSPSALSQAQSLAAAAQGQVRHHRQACRHFLRRRKQAAANASGQSERGQADQSTD